MKEKSLSRRIILADNLSVLSEMPDGCVDLIYVDPPFNTGKPQILQRIRTIRDEEDGNRVGFAGKRYTTEKVSSIQYDDQYDDFLGFLAPRIEQAKRLLTDRGSFFLHLDYRESHYAKVLCDQIFGRSRFMNEIIWSYDYGGRPKNRWPAKHDCIFWYVKDPCDYTFNFDAIDRIPYLAPGLVGAEKAARGKTPTDVWWNTIVPTNGKERTGYPTQKPLSIIDRIVLVHSNPRDTVLDFFAGSGTVGESAAKNGRGFILIDSSIEAVRVMARRLSFASPHFDNYDPKSDEPNALNEAAPI
jgi:site-specific DNA-methyltransferase (adenine-specific)